MRTLDGEYTGWAPRAVRVRALGRRVGAALGWHATSFGRHGGWIAGLTYIAGDITRQRLPFGWVARRAFHLDAYEVGPWWYFAALSLRWKVYWFAKYQLEAVEGPEGGEWSEHRWWPNCWRPGDEDCPPPWLAHSQRLRARLREIKGRQ